MKVWTQQVKCKINMTHKGQGVTLALQGRHVKFACDPLLSYFHEPQKNEIHRLCLHFDFTPFLFIICDFFF